MNTTEQRWKLDFPEMDEQHAYLYRLFDHLPGPDSGEGLLDSRLLGEIERYLSFHFTCEEALMRSYEFPGFAVHQSDHERAAKKFVQFLDDNDAGWLNVAALKIFLTGWLMEHSRLSDTEYVAWIRQKRESVFGPWQSSD